MITSIISFRKTSASKVISKYPINYRAPLFTQSSLFLRSSIDQKTLLYYSIIERVRISKHEVEFFIEMI